MSYNKYIFALIIFTFFCISKVEAGWNEDFYSDTLTIAEQIQELANNDYFSQINDFLIIKSKIEKKQSLYRKIQKAILRRKFNSFNYENNFVVKKRVENCINDVYAWEYSYLLGGSTYIAASYPMEINSNRVVIQKIENIKCGKEIYDVSDEAMEVSLEDYWKSLLILFVLGHSDLRSNNIGITLRNSLLFFDNESVFVNVLFPQQTKNGFYISYASVAFDWPHYRIPLDETLASNLNKFISEMNNRKSEIMLYSEIRNIQNIGMAILANIEILNNFNIEEGTTFLNFIEYLYPQLAPGLDSLSKIVTKIMKRKADHGIALFFATRYLKQDRLSATLRNEWKAWLSMYI